MAYLDVREPILGTAALPLNPTPDATASQVVGFTRSEWDVVVLARRDGLGSLYEPTRFSRALAWLFGARAHRRLADPRLETLRRLAVLAWHHGYAVPVSAIKAFKAAGYTIDQLELLLASIATGRTSRTGRASA